MPQSKDDKNIGSIEGLTKGSRGVEQLYQSAEVGLCVVDRNLGFLHVNRKMAAFHKLPVNEHRGKTIYDVLPGIAAHAKIHLDKILETGEAILDIEVQGPTPSDPEGKKHWRVSYYPVRNESGEIDAMGIVIADNTDQKTVEITLRKNEEHIRRLLETTKAVPWEADAETYRFTYVGPQAAQLTGHSLEEWQGENFWVNTIHPEDRERVLTFCSESMKSQDDYQCEYRLVGVKGEVIWVHDIVHVEREEGRPRLLRGFLIDITERKETEQARDMAEQKYQTIFEQARDGIVLLDAETGRIVDCNREFESQTGRSISELRPMHIWDLLPKSEREPSRARFPELSAKLEIGPTEVRFEKPNGDIIHCEYVRKTIQLGGKTYKHSLVRDVTQRKEAERALQEQAQLLSNVHDCIISTDLEGTIQTWNDGATRVFDYSPSEIIGRNISTLYFEEDLALLADRVIEPLKISGEHSIVVRSRTQGGKEIFMDLRLALLRGEDGSPIGMIGCSTDVTERRRLQEELLRTASVEQRRIGQELHDTTGQELVGLSYLVRSLAAALPENKASSAEIAAKIEEGLERAIGQVRAFSRGLIPVEVETNGLTAALTDLVSRMDELNVVKCRFQYEGPVNVRDNRVATHLYRITQESLTNAIKHAKANEITVRLGAKNGLVELSVKDDGCGIQNANDTHGLGLKIMAYRAELIGARLKIEGGKDQGTTVRCTIASVSNYAALSSE